MSPATDSDEDLMLRFAAGEVAAFDRIYARHRGGLYRYFLRQSGTASAEELFQDVWTRVIQARRRYRPQASFRSWLYTLAHHRLVDHYRRSPPTSQHELEPLADPGPDPERLQHLRDCLQALLQLVRHLPDPQRQAFLMKHEGQLSLSEIAQATGRGLETIKSRLRYAMKTLRAALPATCLEDEA